MSAAEKARGACAFLASGRDNGRQRRGNRHSGSRAAVVSGFLAVRPRYSTLTGTMTWASPMVTQTSPGTSVSS